MKIALILLATLTFAPAQRDTVTIVFGGDVMLSRRVGSAIERDGIDYPFSKIAAILRNADLSIVNLESVAGTATKGMDKPFVFQIPPRYLKALSNTGIDGVSLANNHIYDYYAPALVQCVDSLWKNGVVPIGAGRASCNYFVPRTFFVGGKMFAILALNDTEAGFAGKDKPSCAPTWVSWGESLAYSTIAQAKSLGAVVIVFEHWGWEYDTFPTLRQITLAHNFIDCGAKIVVGSHPHRLQGVEFYKNGAIFYSLGNLVFDQYDFLGNVGALLQLRFYDGEPVGFCAIPIETVTNFARPCPADPALFIDYFRFLCAPFKTKCSVDSSTIIFEP
jgi:poly-gamma-glutamate capsule biosynthesis protein CapA/YwtB (metallophosphatase superfamily)